MSAIRKLASQTGVYGLSSIVGRLINWGLTPFYVNFFSQAEFGMMTDLYALSVYALILLTFGMETSFFHYAAAGRQNPEHAYKSSFNTVLYLSGGFLVVAFLFNAPLSVLLGYEQRPELLQLLWGIIFLDALAALPMARLRHREQPQRFALISLINIAVTLALNILFVKGLGWGLEAVFIANLIASALKLAMALQGNLPLSWRPDWDLIKLMANYGFWIMIAGMVGSLNEMAGRNMIPRLWHDGDLYQGIKMTGQEMNGVFAANYKLGMLMALITQAYRFAAEPFFFREARNKNSPQTYALVFHYFTLMGLGVFLLVSSFAYDIVSFNGFGLLKFTLLPKAYWGGLDAVPVILMANLFLGLYVNLSFWYKITGQLRYGLLIALVGVFVTLATNYLTIPFMGYMGSAYATFMCYFTMCMLSFILGQMFYPIPYKVGRLLVYFIFAIVAYQINAYLDEIGRGTAFIFLLKLAVAGGATAAVWAIEKRKPFDASPKENVLKEEKANQTES